MVIAALVTFGALLIAWVLAPDERHVARAAYPADPVPATATA